MVRYVEYHGLVLIGIFNHTLYNKLIVQNLVENPHKGQMKRVQAVLGWPVLAWAGMGCHGSAKYS